MNLRGRAERPTHVSAAEERVFRNADVDLESSLEEPPVPGPSRGHESNRGTNDGSAAGIDAQGLFGPLTRHDESVESHKHLLYSLGSHLESLGGLLVDCGRAQQEGLNAVEEDLNSFIAKSQLRDLAAPFVRVPPESGLIPSRPSTSRPIKRSVSQPKLPQNPRDLSGMRAVASSRTEHVEFFRVSKSESECCRSPDCPEKYKADYSIYAKTKSKSRQTTTSSMSRQRRRDKQDGTTSFHCSIDQKLNLEDDKVSKAQVQLVDPLERFGTGTLFLLGNQNTHDFSLSGIAESTVGVVILINAFVMGVSEDIKWKGWEMMEFFFTTFFLCEMFAKMYRFGIGDYFHGGDRYWNWFDCFIVNIALVDSGLTIYMRMTQGEDGTDLGRFAQIKILRIGRLGRLIRLLRFKFFSELKVMIQGVFAGLRVLFWAVVLFFSFIYLVAIIAVNLIGNDKNPLIQESFGRVPWAMLTLFMCFTDGCTASDGTPLSYHLFNEYGAGFMVSYMLGVLFVIIGLFNLIMAIFVDNVMESKRINRRSECAMDRTKAESRLRRILRRCCYEQGIGLDGRKSHDEKHSFMIANFDNVSLTREMFCQLLCDKRMERILELLDVETCNRVELFDVLDADMSGELDLEEIIAGLLSLRGPSEKKDAVGALLCGRVTQQLIKDFREHVEAQCHLIRLEQQQLSLFLTNGVSPSRPKSTKQSQVEFLPKRFPVPILVTL